MSNNNRHHSQGSDQPSTAQSTRPSFSVDAPTDNEPTPRPSRASLTAVERPSNETSRSRSRPTALSSPYDTSRLDEHHPSSSSSQPRGDFPEIRAYYAK